MKTIAQTLLAALLLNTAVAASPAIISTTAPTKPTVVTSSFKAAVYPAAAPAKLKVYVERQPGKPMLILLKTSDGTVLSRQSIRKEEGNFYFLFDMAALEDGAYKVEIVSGNDLTIHPVTLSTKPVESATRTISLN